MCKNLGKILSILCVLVMVAVAFSSVVKNVTADEDEELSMLSLNPDVATNDYIHMVWQELTEKTETYYAIDNIIENTTYKYEVYYANNKYGNYMEKLEKATNDVDFLIENTNNNDADRELGKALGKLNTAKEKYYASDFEKSFKNTENAVDHLMEAQYKGADTLEIIRSVTFAVRDMVKTNILYLDFTVVSGSEHINESWQDYYNGIENIGNGCYDKAVDFFKDSFKEAIKALDDFDGIDFDSIVRISYTDYDSVYPQIFLNGTINVGWFEEINNETHIFYARSINDGRTWWYFDANEHADVYLSAIGIDPCCVDLGNIFTVTRALDDIRVVSRCHYFYTPIVIRDGGRFRIDKTRYSPINDPYLDRYWDWYDLDNPIHIGDIDFYIICKPLPSPPPPLPPKAADLIVGSISTSPNNMIAVENDQIIIKANIVNLGDANVSGSIDVNFYDGNIFIDGSTVFNVPSGETAQTSIPWNSSLLGNHSINVKVDQNNGLPEGDEGNNEIVRNVKVLSLDADDDDDGLTNDEELSSGAIWLEAEDYPYAWLDQETSVVTDAEAGNGLAVTDGIRYGTIFDAWNLPEPATYDIYVRAKGNGYNLGLLVNKTGGWPTEWDYSITFGLTSTYRWYSAPNIELPSSSSRIMLTSFVNNTVVRVDRVMLVPSSHTGYVTHPLDLDTDGDGLSDGEEAIQGAYYLEAEKYPYAWLDQETSVVSDADAGNGLAVTDGIRYGQIFDVWNLPEPGIYDVYVRAKGNGYSLGLLVNKTGGWPTEWDYSITFGLTSTYRWYSAPNIELPSFSSRIMLTSFVNNTVVRVDRVMLVPSSHTGYVTHPLDSDTDGDGLSDWEEVKVYRSDPLSWDSDGDSVSDKNDINPLIDTVVSINIKRVKALDDVDDWPYGDADLYVKMKVKDTWQTSSKPITWNDNDISPNIDFIFDIPDDIQTVDIILQVWDDDSPYLDDWDQGVDQCDISGTGSSCDITYDLRTGVWSGDDYQGDSNGYGYSSGNEDGSTGSDENDCGLWFNIYQNDNDNDYLTYWEEVNLWGTNPACSDTDGDSFVDGKDFNPLDSSVGNTLVLDKFNPNYDKTKYWEEEKRGGIAECYKNTVDSSQKIMKLHVGAMTAASAFFPLAEAHLYGIMGVDYVEQPSSGDVDISLTFDKVSGSGDYGADGAWAKFQINIQVYNSGGVLVAEKKVYDYTLSQGDSINWADKTFTMSCYLPKDKYSLHVKFYVEAVSTTDESNDNAAWICFSEITVDNFEIVMKE